jgi:quercetin dioxygenase-like cupin family protein
MTGMRHRVRLAADADYVAPPGPRGDEGFTCWSIVDESTEGSAHTDFAVCVLAPGSSLPARVQSFEECFFVLEGSMLLRTVEGAVRLTEGDYGLLPVGMAHSWRNDGDSPARWARMLASQPRAKYRYDRFEVAELPDEVGASTVDVRDPRNRLFGHIEAEQMRVDRQRQERLAVSASMRTALLVYSGITVKMMVDSDLGALHTTMFMVHYDPEGVASPHDHPFEETYLFLEGEVEALFDGVKYRLGVGDAAFAGVGCVHGFRAIGGGPVRWLETQAPQPPGRHSYRFVRDWDYLRSVTGGQ